MMRQYELVERVQAYNPDADESLLNRAYVYAMQMHGRQKRASGDPYFSHPLEVAGLLLDLKLDETTIVAALLHDVVEDTKATSADIEAMFGADAARLVDGVTKLSKIEQHDIESAQAENFRKLMLAVSDDIRVILIKLADRLHNMRTLQYLPVEKRLRIARETLEVYAPFAGRIGLFSFKENLEDLAFRQLNREQYDRISERLEDLFAAIGDAVKRIPEELHALLEAAGVKAEIFGRRKTIYSIWEKMNRRKVPMEKLADIMAFRIIVPNEDDCYRTLGVVHRRWRMIPDRFRDYLSLPKENGYQSLQTTVLLEKNQRVELQIRTHEMNAVAEHGVAAHYFYKKGEMKTNPESVRGEAEAYRWIRKIVDEFKDGHTPEEFLNHTIMEMVHKNVYCFTRDGHLICLPSRATALDFAYAVHTDLGDRALACRINGVEAPLDRVLENGDEIVIFSSKTPIIDGRREDMAITGRARGAVRRRLRDATTHQKIKNGRDALRRGMAQRGLKLTQTAVAELMNRCKLVDEDALFTKITDGEIGLSELLSAAAAGREGAKSAAACLIADPRPGLLRWVGKRAPILFAGGGVRAAGGEIQDKTVLFSRAAGALPGERIVAISDARQLIVYPIDSALLESYDAAADEAWLDVKWDAAALEGAFFPALIEVSALNQIGVLAHVTKTIGDLKANISNFSMKDRKINVFKMEFEIEVEDKEHLHRILTKLGALHAAMAVEHIRR